MNKAYLPNDAQNLEPKIPDRFGPGLNDAAVTTAICETNGRRATNRLGGIACHTAGLSLSRKKALLSNSKPYRSPRKTGICVPTCKNQIDHLETRLLPVEKQPKRRFSTWAASACSLPFPKKPSKASVMPGAAPDSAGKALALLRSMGISICSRG